jgi:hypothetical protein
MPIVHSEGTNEEKTELWKEGRKKERQRETKEERRELMNEGWPSGMKKERKIKTKLTEDLEYDKM